MKLILVVFGIAALLFGAWALLWVLATRGKS